MSPLRSLILVGDSSSDQDSVPAHSFCPHIWTSEHLNIWTSKCSRDWMHQGHSFSSKVHWTNEVCMKVWSMQARYGHGKYWVSWYLCNPAVLAPSWCGCYIFCIFQEAWLLHFTSQNRTQAWETTFPLYLWKPNNPDGKSLMLVFLQNLYFKRWGLHLREMIKK